MAESGRELVQQADAATPPPRHLGSVQELVAAIKDYLKHHNADRKPFVWSTTVDTILRKVRKCKVILGTYH